MSMDLYMMEEEISNTAKDLEAVARIVAGGNMTSNQALLVVQQLTTNLNTKLCEIITRIHSQPIIPGMERIPAQ